MLEPLRLPSERKRCIKEPMISFETHAEAESRAGSLTSLWNRCVGFWDWCKSLTGLRFVVAFLLPDLPFRIAGALLHQHSGVINVDYVILTILAASGFPVLASILLVMTYLMEALRLLDALYFFSQQDLPYAAHFIGTLPLSLIVSWIVAFSVFGAVMIMLWLAVTPRLNITQVGKACAGVALVALAFIGVDLARGYNPLFHPSTDRPRSNIVIESLVRVPRYFWHAPPGSLPGKPIQHSATDPLWAASEIAKTRENVVVVLVESMGLLQDEQSRANEFRTLNEDKFLKQKYSVQEGVTPFTGSTVVGEMRELCHLETGMNITAATFSGSGPCLPEEFRRLGYQTAAFHGFRSTMFDRKDWYPKLGFSETHYYEGMRGLPMCNGVFYGVCDSAVASVLEKRLTDQKNSAGSPQFLYWLTLNSHLPVDVQPAAIQECPILAERSVCAQLGYVQRVLKAVKTLALDPAIGPTVIVVVGDHAPPYVSVARRKLYSDEEVPFLVLRPLS
ncbi:MAG: sulfatase-like hydrolase/transferase [Terriglobus sp.]